MSNYLPRQEVQKFTNNDKHAKHHHVHLFTTTSLMDIMKNFSDVNIGKVLIGYVLMLIYAAISLIKRNDSINSQGLLAISGVTIIALSAAAGLGFCALIGLPFNASTTQVKTPPLLYSLLAARS